MKKWYDEEYEFEIEVTGYLHEEHTKEYCRNGEEIGDKYSCTYGCTVENQEAADYRLPIFLSYPIKHRFIACAPLLEPIDLSESLHAIEHVTVGGETSRSARECNYEWVLSIREQCIRSDTTFWFKNTGSLFRENGELQKVNPFKQNGRAKELGLDTMGDKKLF